MWMGNTFFVMERKRIDRITNKEKKNIKNFRGSQSTAAKCPQTRTKHTKIEAVQGSTENHTQGGLAEAQ